MMFSDDSNEPRLTDEAEALLGNWPIAERDSVDWEALAARVDAKVRISETGSTPDELLQAPLPDVADDREVQRRSHPRMKRPSEGSLVALARASLGDEQSDSDELARALLSQAMRARNESRGSASGSFEAPAQPVSVADLVNAPSTAPTATVQRAGPRRAPLEVVSDQPAMGGGAEAVVAQPVPGENSTHQRRIWLGMAFGVVGMAAAAVLVVGGAREKGTAASEPAEAVTTPVPGEAGPAKLASVPKKTTPKPAAPRPLLNVEDVPLGDPEETGQTADKQIAQAVLQPKRARPAVEAETSKPEVAAPDPGPEAPSVGPSEPGMVMADSHGHALPDQPSTGAVQVAVGSVMGAARACVAGQSTASRATVRFGSDGRVDGVSVTGPAAGTSAESCVRAALSGAKVQPFSRASFAVTLTVRP